MKVRKRNGKIVDFDKNKIKNAILKAFKACNVEDQYGTASTIADEISVIVAKEYKDNEAVTIDEIQDLVEQLFVREVDIYGKTLFNVAKKYILYRDRRDKDRESINKLSKIFSEIINISDNDTKKSNANIDGNTPAGQMQIFASESAKDYATHFLVNPKYIQANETGYIHLHDFDYYPTKAWNCNHISLVDLFSHDYIYTNDSVMRPPKRISSFAALAAISLQSEQNEQFGGQSLGDFDWGMAKGVALTFRETFKKYYKLFYKQSAEEEFKDEEIRIDNQQLRKSCQYIYDAALEETRKETHEAMAAFIYNLCSMHSRG